MTTLAQNRLQLSEHYCSAYSAALLDSQTVKDALVPEFWAHVAHKMRQHDTIRLIPERGDYYALLVVTQVGRAFAKVKMVHYVNLTGSGVLLPEGQDAADTEVMAALIGEGGDDPVGSDTPPAIPPIAFDDEMSVEWKGPHVKWAVIRKSDNERLREGFSNKNDAEAWARDHKSALVR